MSASEPLLDRSPVLLPGVEAERPATLEKEAPHADAERLERFKRTKFEALARQAVRAPVPMFLAAMLTAFVVRNEVPFLRVAIWIGAIMTVVVTRWLYSRWAVAHPQGNVDERLRAMVALSVAGGLAAGVGALLFLPHIDPADKAIVTMLLVSWASGAVSTNAAHRPAYFAYVIPMLTPLATLWALGGTIEGMSVAFLIVMIVVLQTGFVRDNERIFRQSFDIRYENERLIRELQLQRQAVIHERDRAEEANRAKSRFLAAASHDLRQPLHAISLYSASLSVRNADERTAELAGRINAGIGSLSSLLDGLLDISKLDAEAVLPEPSIFAIDALMLRLVSDFRPIAVAKGLALESQCPERVFVHTDALLLERILRNLLDNAVKYTSLGGVTLHASVDGQRVVISVMDTGDGIPEAEHERIFEEFYQISNPERDRSRGLGLGLAIVQRLSRLLGIDLRLRSRVGEGSVFTLSLPRARQDLPKPEPVAAQGDEADNTLPEGLRVLIVDDEAAIRHGMQTLLDSWGCRVTAVADTRGALEALAAGPIDVVVADFRLRGGETGVALANTARAQYGAPVLLVTGDTAPDRLREASSFGLTLLHKPLSERELRRHLAAACRGSSSAGIGPQPERSAAAAYAATATDRK
jgi:signal transduction histidine kinase/CheY-like chemotaxis protein